MRRIHSAVSLTALLTAAAGSSPFAASVHAQAWTQIAPAVAPDTREGAVLVYDPVRKQMVLFGGRALDSSDETWILEGDVWTKQSPSKAPQARWNAYGYWDSTRERVVVVDGSAEGQIDRSVIWSWDGSDWSSFTPSANPPPRRDAAFAYDSVRDRLVLFGGVVDGSPDATLADTWEFDGSTWVETTPQDSPGDRGAALMGYDPVRKIVVLVNGYSETVGDLRSDTWVYADGDWAEATSASTPHGSSLEMIWNPTQQKLMIAGRNETGSLTSWTFDGAVWTEHATSTYSLNGIPEASLAFDTEAGAAVYLRQENQRLVGYQLDGATWNAFLPVAQPGGAEPGRGALIFNAEANEPQLFADSSDGLQGWRWDGVMWRSMEIGGAKRPNATSRIAYDAGRGRVVAFDGLTYEIEDNSWSIKSSASAPSTAGGMAYDKDRGRLVYYGGVVAFAMYSDITWTWDGASWTQLTPLASATPRRGPALAYDERRQRMVLFGGQGVVSGQVRNLFDTWEMRANTWAESPVDMPTDFRDTPSMTYDQARQRIVLWGAQDDEEAQLWEYDGNKWVGSEAPPIAGITGVLAYDAAGKRVLLHDKEGRTWARAAGTPAPEDPATDAGTTPGGSGNGDGDAHGDGDANGDANGDGSAVDGGTSGEDGGAGSKRRGDSGCAAAPAASSRTGIWAWFAALAFLHRRRKSREHGA